MSLMAMPKNTSTAHYVLAGLAVIGSTLCAYAAYAGAGTGAMIDSIYLNYFGMFMTGAFGLGFIFAPEMLMRMKANFGTFDDNHKFLAQFCGFTMVTVCYTIYALTDPDGGFRLTAIWLAGAGLLGPTRFILYMEPVMTPEGVGGDPVLILIAGVLGLLGSM